MNTRQKKSLYESIMKNVAKLVKHTLNEEAMFEEANADFYTVTSLGMFAEGETKFFKNYKDAFNYANILNNLYTNLLIGPEDIKEYEENGEDPADAVAIYFCYFE